MNKAFSLRFTHSIPGETVPFKTGNPTPSFTQFEKSKRFFLFKMQQNKKMLVGKAAHNSGKLICSKGQDGILYIFLQMLIVWLLVYPSWHWRKYFQWQASIYQGKRRERSVPATSVATLSAKPWMKLKLTRDYGCPIGPSLGSQAAAFPHPLQWDPGSSPEPVIKTPCLKPSVGNHCIILHLGILVYSSILK